MVQQGSGRRVGVVDRMAEDADLLRAPEEGVGTVRRRREVVDRFGYAAQRRTGRSQSESRQRHADPDRPAAVHDSPFPGPGAR